jgi:hypothetical protein
MFKSHTPNRQLLQGIWIYPLYIYTLYNIGNDHNPWTRNSVLNQPIQWTDMMIHHDDNDEKTSAEISLELAECEWKCFQHPFWEGDVNVTTCINMLGFDYIRYH